MNLRRAAVLTLLLLSLVVVGFLAAAWWHQPPIEEQRADAGATQELDDSRVEGASRVTTGAIEGSPATATIAPSISPAPVWPPLPPLEQPLAENFEALVDRARGGDAGAACRLGAQLQECMRARNMHQTVSDIERDAARGDATPHLAVQAIDRLQQDAMRVGTRCEGLSASQLQQAFDWQRQAAQSDPALRLWFVLNPALDRRNFVNELERWASYRQVALPWLEGLAAEGDLAAVIALARVFGDHRRSSPPLPPFRIPDDERFIVYAELMSRYGAEFQAVSRSADAARARLSPEALRNARRQADALHRADVGPRDDASVRSVLDRTFAQKFDPEKCGA